MSSEEGKYYWIKLSETFFTKDKAVKKMESTPTIGPSFVKAYIKMLVFSAPSNGVFYYEGIEDTIDEEIALLIGEEPEIITGLIVLLRKFKYIEEGVDSIRLTKLSDLVGSETKAAERMRRSRENKKNVTLLQPVTTCYTEKEIEKEKEIDIDNRERVKEREGNAANEGAPTGYTPPSLSDIINFCKKEELNYVNPEAFYHNYESVGWKVNGEYLHNWKSRLRKWNTEDEKKAKEVQKTGKPNGFNNFPQRSYDFKEYERRFFGQEKTFNKGEKSDYDYDKIESKLLGMG